MVDWMPVLAGAPALTTADLLAAGRAPFSNRW